MAAAASSSSSVTSTTATTTEKPKPVAAAAVKPEPVPVTVIRGKQRATVATRSLLEQVGGRETIRKMCTTFYSLAFEDDVLKRFMFASDGAAEHGRRLGDWIAEKMGDAEAPWSTTRPPDARQMSHYQAWHSPRRERHKVGRRFKLDDCRVWMRLMFLAGRRSGVAGKYPAFWDWYVRFIGHFIAVYERTAPPFAADADRWASDAARVKAYEEGSRRMDDVIGLGLSDAVKQLPSSERAGWGW